MTNFIQYTVTQMITYANDHPRLNTIERPITNYQKRVTGLIITYFHTATKTTLSLARKGKTPPSPAQLKSFKKLFHVPKYAQTERSFHPQHSIIRLTWKRIKPPPPSSYPI